MSRENTPPAGDRDIRAPTGWGQRQRSGGLGQDAAESHRGGATNLSEAEAVTDGLARDLRPQWLYSDDRSLGRERPVSGLERDLQRSLGRDDQVKAEAESASANVLRSSLVQGSGLTFGMAYDRKFYGNPNDGPPHHPLPIQQISEGSVPVGECPIKNDAVDRPVLRSQLFFPHDLALNRNAALVGPEKKRKGDRRINRLGEFQTGSPLAEVAGPSSS